jgi:hypothetical protein
MDVLAIVRSLRRHWRWTVPIVLITFVVAGYVYFATPPSYEATASYVLFPAPTAPTPDDIKANPSLGLVHADNPYARMDQAVVVDILAKRVNDDTNRQRLEARGADSGYKVVTGGLYGISSPTADIKGTGDSAARAIATAQIVGKDFADNLHQIQAAQGTDDQYMVKAVEVDAPTSATQKSSSRLRSMLAVLGLGALVLFVMISIAEAFDSVKRERSERRSQFVLPATLDRADSAARAKSPLKTPGEPLEPAENGVVSVPGNGGAAPSANGGGNATARWR